VVRHRRERVPHLTTSDGTAMIPLGHQNNATDQLISVEVVQDNAWFVPSELVSCGRQHGDAKCSSYQIGRCLPDTMWLTVTCTGCKWMDETRED
jgi:hypothetical protein